MIVRNRDGHVWLGKRIGDTKNYWQFPQGGVEASEDVRITATRELYEETGMQSITLLAHTEQPIAYQFPDEIARSAYGGHYAGQEMTWFLFSFHGEDSEINLTVTTHAEFDAWRWTTLDFALDHVISFKRDAYERAFKNLGLM